MKETQIPAVDRRPMIWALSLLIFLIVSWSIFNYFGAQRFYNTALWQSWRPIVLKSQPQTATPVEVRDEWRNALTVVQTEKGLYFLSGTRNIPPAGSAVTVQANDHWELYMCTTADEKCMTIHSFCAGAVWPELDRDEKGRAKNCYAPYLGDRPAAELKEPPPEQERRGGPGRRGKKTMPPLGISHPREWAAQMGLPLPAPVEEK